MSLAAGTHVGPYEIVDKLGEGGMGEVYRAHDSKLNRDVALKVLPESLAGDPERLARFQREAQVLAALNHPNIGHIYGFEDSGSTHALVLELIEGPTLAGRIARGPIPLEEALGIARQIIEALEAAHDQGIIHRDLKPANIKVRDDGTVKVLDFGLAKALDPSVTSGTASASLANSPTMTSPAMTAMGMILGTAAYMSPEQARGKAVDKRADIWAFGVVLYEMLTGRRAFEDEDVSLTLSKVLQRDPDFDTVPDEVPERVRQVVRLCLRKQAKDRIPDIGTVRLALDGAFDVPVLEGAAPATPAPASQRSRLIAAVLVTAAVVGALAFGVPRLLQQGPVAAPTARFSVAPPEGLAFPGSAVKSTSLSPDGRWLAFIARKRGARRSLWLRDMDNLTARELPDTAGAESPFWSPDNRYLGFFGDGQIKKVDAAGGTTSVVCSCPGDGGSWSRDDVIIFTSTNDPTVIMQVPASGGVPAPVTTLAEGEFAHFYPTFLPDGRKFFYGADYSDTPKVFLGSLDDESRTLVLDHPDSPYVVFTQGHLLWTRDETLVAQPFDTRRLALVGDPVTVAADVRNSLATSASDTGLLVYQAGKRADSPLTWLDRKGTLIKREEVGGVIQAPNLSRDGTRLAMERVEGNRSDIWVLDLIRGANTRLTFDQKSDRPVFSGDGTRVAFGKNDSGMVFVRRSSATGTEEEVVEGEPTDWSPDNEHILFIRKGDLWDWSMSDRTATAIVTGPGNNRRGRFSPDGKWIAYESNESGQYEIYVQRFPTTSERWQVSTTGGGSAWWRNDGRELFYLSPNGQIMAVDATLGQTFEQGVPKALFEVPGTVPNGRFVASLDGQQFLMPIEAGPPRPLTVLVNWKLPGT